MEQRISLVTLGVGDLDRSREFYERLSWRRSMADAEGIVFFQTGGIAFSLYPRADLARDANIAPDAGGATGVGAVALAHNTRTREEVDAVMAEAEAAGATILKPAEDAFWGGYSGSFADPDGHPWEVAWNPNFALDADGNVALPE